MFCKSDCDVFRESLECFVKQIIRIKQNKFYFILIIPDFFNIFLISSRQFMKAYLVGIKRKLLPLRPTIRMRIQYCDNN